jgi:hypothetical protein
MKYAFVIGSNAFVVLRNTISYGEDGQQKEFLRINAIYHDLPGKEASFLDVSLDVRDAHGNAVTIRSNDPVVGVRCTVKRERDNIHVLNPDGSLIIQVHQLDDDSAMALEHNITAEFEVNVPVAVIRITGDFRVGDLHIRAENEKLFINDNGYANSVQSGKNDLKFSSAGVVL